MDRKKKGIGIVAGIVAVPEEIQRAGYEVETLENKSSFGHQRAWACGVLL